MLRARAERGCCYNLSQQSQKLYRATLLAAMLSLLLLATFYMHLHNQDAIHRDNRRLCDDSTDIAANFFGIGATIGGGITVQGVRYALDPETNTDILEWGVVLLVMMVGLLVISRTGYSKDAWEWISSICLIGAVVTAKIAVDQIGETVMATGLTTALGISACILMAIFVLLQISSHLTVRYGKFHKPTWIAMIPYAVFVGGMALSGAGLFVNLANNGNTFDTASVNGLETGLSMCSTLLLIYLVYGAYNRGEVAKIAVGNKNILSKTGSIVIGAMIGVTGILVAASMWDIEDEVWNTCQSILLPLCVCGLIVSVLLALYGRLLVNDKFVFPWQIGGGYVGNFLLAAGVVSTVGGTCAIIENMLGDNIPAEINCWWFVVSGLSLLAGIIYRACEGRGDKDLRSASFWGIFATAWRMLTCQMDAYRMRKAQQQIDGGNPI